ncbi:hypothetical protein HDU67_001489 [Dinochytrium kinnereticum]|nr:hypothetical protein HDU67_001489 [Dinochytrium kinnereticum]
MSVELASAPDPPTDLEPGSLGAGAAGEEIIAASSAAVLLTPTAVVNGEAVPQVEKQAQPSGPKPQEQKHKFIGNYEILKTVGEGSFARVKLAIHRLTNQKVAIKVIDKERLPDNYSMKNIHREAQIMRMLDHPNIIQLYEVMETKKELFLVLEYAAGGELLDYIVSHGRLKENEARKFVQQIVSALGYCHSHNIAHRDLKSENLLLGDDQSIKISDFGLSNLYEKGATLGTCCGSPVYSAPELIEGKRYVGPEVDAWSLGINLYAMVVGDLPFANSNLTALYESILKGKYEVPDHVSPECKDLISKLLVINPHKRYTCAQVQEHPWMTMTGSFLTSDEESEDVPKLRPQNEEELDNEILEHLEQMGFEASAAASSVLQGKFNQAAGTYLLLLTQKKQEIAKYGAEMVMKKQQAQQAEKAVAAAAASAAGTHPAVAVGAGTMEELEAMNRKIAEDRERMNDGTTSEALANMMIEWERARLNPSTPPTTSPKASRAVIPNALAVTSKDKGKRQRAKTMASGVPAYRGVENRKESVVSANHYHQSDGTGLLSASVLTPQNAISRSRVRAAQDGIHEVGHCSGISSSHSEFSLMEKGTDEGPHSFNSKSGGAGVSHRRPSQSVIVNCASPWVAAKPTTAADHGAHGRLPSMPVHQRSKSIAPSSILPPLVSTTESNGLKSNHTAMIDIASASSGNSMNRDEGMDNLNRGRQASRW